MVRNKKYFVGTDSKTKKVKIGTYSAVVAEITNVPLQAATNYITSADVTINGDVVDDITHVLQVGDVVRVAEGHMVKNVNFVAIMIAA